MKKKVFFVLSSLTSGGSERVFWLLSQYIDKSIFEVTIVILNSKKIFFSTDLKDVRIIDLRTVKASRSFFKLLSLLKKEKPYAVFATGGQINTLVAVVSLFVHVPFLIARLSNIPDERKRYMAESEKGNIWAILSGIFLRRFRYQRFNTIICQSEEMKSSLLNLHHHNISNKLVVIPNPVVPAELSKESLSASSIKRIIVVGRLVKLKGHIRLLEVFKSLPTNYTLTIAGDGPMRSEIESKVQVFNLGERVEMLGQVSGIEMLISQHDLLVSASFTEGFPNVVVEALSVGIPVVAFKVGGVSNMIIDDFNGFIVNQDDLADYRDKIVKACCKNWDFKAIKDDANKRFSIREIALRYQKLIA